MLLCIIKAYLVTLSPLAYFRHPEALCFLTREAFALWVSIVLPSPGHHISNYCFLFCSITESYLECSILQNFSHYFSEPQRTLPAQGQIHSSQVKRSLSWTVRGWWHIWAPWDLGKAGRGTGTSRSETWHVRHNAVVRRCKSYSENISARKQFCPSLYSQIQFKAFRWNPSYVRDLTTRALHSIVWPGKHYKICESCSYL